MGTSLVLGGVFNSGILATGPIDGATFDYTRASPEILARVADLQSSAEALGLPLATAALLFAKQHDLSASVLIGTAKATTLGRNLLALTSTVPQEFAKTFLV